MPTNAQTPSDLLQCLGRYNIPILLDPYYKAEQLKTIQKFAYRHKVGKKDFGKDQAIYTPQILLYMIMMSEDDILEHYLNCWRKYHHVRKEDLQIPEEIITPDLREGCGCSGCFGRCVQIANRYGLLPKVINHNYMTEMLRHP